VTLTFAFVLVDCRPEERDKPTDEKPRRKLDLLGEGKGRRAFAEEVT